jgi:ATP-dependent Clp protease ATP-binding subunit ClpC
LQRKIGSIAICEKLDRFNDRGFNLTISEEAFEFLIRRGIQKMLGARPMRKTVEKFVEDAVRDALKSGARSSGVLTVSTLNGRLIIQ